MQHEGLASRQANPSAGTEYPIALTDQASERILVMDPAEPDWNKEEAVLWSWAPSETNGFAGLTAAWGLPNDAKLRRSRVWGGEWMIVTDSRGLAAIVPYPAGDSRQWGRNVGGNPHSAELLPDGNLAVAASTGGWVRLYASSQGPDSGRYAEYPFPGAHGLVWDEVRHVLWAVGDDHLVALAVEGTSAEPALRESFRIELPNRHGHDLQPVPGDPDRLWVSSGSQIYLYVKSSQTFTEDAQEDWAAINRRAVKSVGNQPSGRVVQTVPQKGSLYSWTTDTVDLFRPEAQRVRTGAAIYKARIWQPDVWQPDEADEAAAGRMTPSDPAQWRVATSYRLETAERVEETLQAMADAGLAYLELAWLNKPFNMFEPERQQFVDSLIAGARARGLDIWTLHLPYGVPFDVSTVDEAERQAAVERHLQLLQLAHRWGIRTAVLHPSWEPIRPEERPARLAACKRSLAVLAEAAHGLGIRIGVECLPRTCLGNTSDEMAELMEASALLGITCDVNHLVQEPPEAFIRKLGHRIISVHMSDNDGTDEKHWLPGKGIIRWPAVIGALAAAGYAGPFVFEVRQITPGELMDCWQRLLRDYEQEVSSSGIRQGEGEASA